MDHVEDPIRNELGRIEWFLYVDIEGFSRIYHDDSTQAISLLRGLMRDLYVIGDRIYPGEYPDKLEADRTRRNSRSSAWIRIRYFLKYLFQRFGNPSVMRRTTAKNKT
jgi:hypothetical protein